MCKDLPEGLQLFVKDMWIAPAEVLYLGSRVLDKSELYWLFDQPVKGSDGNWYNVEFTGILQEVAEPEPENE